MNDASEFKYTAAIYTSLITTLEKNFRNANLNTPTLHILKTFIDSIKVMSEAMPHYICSFSQKGDDLYQWNSYGSKGEGYSLGFRKEYLEDLVKKDGVNFIAQCIYDEKKQLELILSFIKESPGKVNKFFQSYNDFANLILNTHSDQQRKLESDMLEQIYYLLAKIKYPSFDAEEEFRIIIPDLEDPRWPIKYRQGRSTKIPYIEFPLRIANEKLKIDKIIIGPALHLELYKKSIETILADNEVICEDIQPSCIPYRII